MRCTKRLHIKKRNSRKISSVKFGKVKCAIEHKVVSTSAEEVDKITQKAVQSFLECINLPNGDYY